VHCSEMKFMNWSLVFTVFWSKVLKYLLQRSLESLQFSCLECLTLDVFIVVVLIRIWYVASNPILEPFSRRLPSENFLKLNVCYKFELWMCYNGLLIFKLLNVIETRFSPWCSTLQYMLVVTNLGYLGIFLINY